MLVWVPVLLDQGHEFGGDIVGEGGLGLLGFVPVLDPLLDRGVVGLLGGVSHRREDGVEVDIAHAGEHRELQDTQLNIIIKPQTWSIFLLFCY